MLLTFANNGEKYVFFGGENTTRLIDFSPLGKSSPKSTDEWINIRLIYVNQIEVQLMWSKVLAILFYF